MITLFQSDSSYAWVKWNLQICIRVMVIARRFFTTDFEEDKIVSCIVWLPEASWL